MRSGGRRNGNRRGRCLRAGRIARGEGYRVVARLRVRVREGQCLRPLLDDCLRCGGGVALALIAPIDGGGEIRVAVIVDDDGPRTGDAGENRGRTGDAHDGRACRRSERGHREGQRIGAVSRAVDDRDIVGTQGHDLRAESAQLCGNGE